MQSSLIRNLRSNSHNKSYLGLYQPIFLKIIFAFGYLVMYNYAYPITSKIFAYEGIIYAPHSTTNVIMSQILAFCLLLFIPTKLARPSDFFNLMLILIVGAPCILVSSFLGVLSENETVFFQLTVLLFFLVLNTFKMVPLINIMTLNISNYLFWGIAISSTTLTILSFSLFPFPTSFLTLGEVYDARRSFKSSIANLTLIFYLYSFQTNVVNTLMLFYFVERKQYLKALAVIALQIYIFSVTGLKFYLFFIFAAFTLYLVIKYRSKNFMSYAVFGTYVLSIFGALIYQVSGSFLLLTLFFRRLLVVPSQLSVYYYDFFKDKDLVLLSNSFSGFLKAYEYDLGLALLIGRNYFGSDTAGANVNMVLDSYVQFGLFGVVGYALIVGVMLLIIDSLSKQKPYAILCVAVFMMGMLLGATSLTTALLSHGLFGLFVMIYLYPNKTEEQKQQDSEKYGIKMS